jgi:hypothetical protein
MVPIPMFILSFDAAEIKLVVNSGAEQPRAKMYPEAFSDKLYCLAICLKHATIKKYPYES